MSPAWPKGERKKCSFKLYDVTTFWVSSNDIWSSTFFPTFSNCGGAHLECDASICTSCCSCAHNHGTEVTWRYQYHDLWLCHDGVWAQLPENVLQSSVRQSWYSEFLKIRYFWKVLAPHCPSTDEQLCCRTRNQHLSIRPKHNGVVDFEAVFMLSIHKLRPKCFNKQTIKVETKVFLIVKLSWCCWRASWDQSVSISKQSKMKTRSNWEVYKRCCLCALVSHRRHPCWRGRETGCLWLAFGFSVFRHQCYLCE